MSRDRDSQWQQQKTDEVSTFEQSGFRQSSTLDSLPPGERPSQRRPSRRPSRRPNRSRKPSWILVLILMVLLAIVGVLKVISHLT